MSPIDKRLAAKERLINAAHAMVAAGDTAETVQELLDAGKAWGRLDAQSSAAEARWTRHTADRLAAVKTGVGLPENQARLLAYWNEYVTREGCRPTHREMGEALGVTTQGARYLWAQLAKHRAPFLRAPARPRTRKDDDE